MSEPLLVSLHIPKTAGSTLLRVFAERFGERFQRAYKPPVTGQARTGSDGWPDIPDPQRIHGHSVLDRFPWVVQRPDARFVTFFREPLAGAVSLWRYQRRRMPLDAANPQAIPAHVDEFLLNRYNHNRYRKWIQRSGRNLEQFFLVGIVERFDVSMTVLFRLCGWPDVPYGHENQSTGEPPSIIPATVEKFHGLNQDDYDLYARAGKLLDAHVRRLGLAG